MDWYDKEEVMRACAIGEMANILIESMGWKKAYEKYKKDMFEYMKDFKQVKKVEKQLIRRQR